jgi:hypothetical protein
MNAPVVVAAGNQGKQLDGQLSYRVENYPPAKPRFIMNNGRLA